MEFSEKTEPMIHYFLDNFRKFYKKRKRDDQVRLDEKYKKLFNEIKKENEIFDDSKLLKELNEIFIEDQIPKPKELLQSNYVPKEIREFIFEESKFYVKYKYVIEDPIKGIKRKIEINFVMFTMDDMLKVKKYDAYVKYMIMALGMISKHAKADCCKKLRVFIYLTDFERELPKTSIWGVEPINVNGGLTTNCGYTNEICIYRKEEFFKVFLHECFHAFNMDFSTRPQLEVNKKMKKIFNVDSDFNIYEAYCEFWATILNNAFISFKCSLNKQVNKPKMEDFLLYLDFCNKLEVIFSLFQLNKLTTFFSITYDSFYEQNQTSKDICKYLYKEKTNVFSYYVLKTILLFHYEDFLSWCYCKNTCIFRFENPKSILNVSKKMDEFVEFLKNFHKTEDLLNSIHKMKFLNYGLGVLSVNNLQHTLRMTLLEFK